MTAYCHSWKSVNWLDNTEIPYTAGSDLRSRGLRVGDEVYVVANNGGHLYLGGVINVVRIVGKLQAQRIMRRDVWEAPEFAFPMEPQPFFPDIQVPIAIVKALRLGQKATPLVLNDGLLDQQTLRGLRKLSVESATAFAELLLAADKADAIERQIQGRKDIGQTEKWNLLKSRIGQGRYRENLCKFEKFCRVTGCDDPKYMKASHIKPWCNSTDFERLDGNNGLLLSPHVDHIFDQGLISFSDGGVLLISPALNLSVLEKWNIELSRNSGTFSKKQIKYLDYHRQYVFKK